MDINCKAPVLSIVVPCYNEEEVLSDTSSKLLSVLQHLIAINKISESSIVYFVDDGSVDATWATIVKLSEDSGFIKGLKLTRNYGHQNALLAGLLTTKGDITVSIDADLQDDLCAIEEMVDAFHDGADVVYGVRKKREKDGFFKRVSAEGYYKLLKSMGVNIVFNHADFRLLSRRVITALESYQETNLFLRGMIPSIGYSSSIVSYDRKERSAGESKYPIRKMLSLALNGITSYTSFPLRLIAGLGLLVFFVTIVLSCWVLWASLYDGNAVPGWASSVLPMYLLGGVQLFSIGVLGEYVGKVYMETKKRPRFIIDKEI